MLSQSTGRTRQHPYTTEPAGAYDSVSKPLMICRSRCLRVVVLVVLLGFAASAIAHAQEPAPATPPNEIAFVNVHTITMADDRVRNDQVVLVRNGRIVAMGSRSQIPVPPEAHVIDGEGRYLVPGLTDAHVHLDGDGTRFGTSRPDFGDGPLYLAHGVTTVINLRGLPEHLEWRRRVESGDLVGPTIYTAGEFVNEPRVFTAEDVQREIAAQAEAGFDLIKFREVYTREAGEMTTVGLSRETYMAMNDAARALDLPLVGHAPVNLGLEAVLEARQPLAHLGTLSNVYFLPLAGNRVWVIVTGLAFAVLLLLTVISGVAAIVRSRRPIPRVSQPISRIRIFADSVLLTSVLTGAAAILLLPGGPWFASTVLRVVFTVLCLGLAVMASTLLVVTVTTWQEPRVSRARRTQASIASVVGLVLATASLAFWVPIAWRSSDAGIEWLATRLRDEGIPVQTTLVAYDAIGGPGKARLIADPVLGYLRDDVQTRWQRLSQNRLRAFRYTDFMKKVAGILSREGVMLVAGTDAMGFPLVAPGSSLHRELELLIESGLTPYEAMRTATIAPAQLLRRESAFGTITVGRRADLVLVDGNPLEDITRLRQPAGVMARGRWFTREELRGMLAALDHE